MRRGMGGGAEKGVAVDALIGPDRHEPKLARAAKAPGMRGVAGRRNIVPGEEREGDVDDFHGAEAFAAQRVRWIGSPSAAGAWSDRARARPAAWCARPGASS